MLEWGEPLLALPPVFSPERRLKFFLRLEVAMVVEPVPLALVESALL